MTPELRPGERLAGFQVVAVAGAGPVGVVYRAEQLVPPRPVALTVVAAELAADPAFRMRFRSATELAATVDHPNVVPVYAAGEAAGTLFVAAQWVEGETLADLLARSGPVEPERAVELVSQVAAGLDAARARGLVHRALGSTNVWVRPDGRLLVGGFGLMRRVPTGIGESGSSQWLGEAAYASPEQIRGGRVDARADIYSLGCLLFELLTGRPPFERESDLAVMWAHTADEPPRLPADLPPGLNRVVANALAKDRRDRFGTASALAAAAAAALREGAAAARPTPAASAPACPEEPDGPPAPAAGTAGTEGDGPEPPARPAGPRPASPPDRPLPADPARPAPESARPAPAEAARPAAARSRRRRIRLPSRAIGIAVSLLAVAVAVWGLWPDGDGSGSTRPAATESRGESCGEAPDVREVWAVAVDCRTALRVAQEWSDGDEPDGFSCRNNPDGTRTCTSGIRRVTFVPNL